MPKRQKLIPKKEGRKKRSKADEAIYQERLRLEEEEEEEVRRTQQGETQKKEQAAAKNAASHRRTEEGDYEGLNEMTLIASKNVHTSSTNNRTTATTKEHVAAPAEQSKSLKRQAVSAATTCLPGGSQQIVAPIQTAENGTPTSNSSSIQNSATSQTMNVAPQQPQQQQDPTSMPTTTRNSSSLPCSSASLLALSSGGLRAHAVRIPPGHDLVLALQWAAEMAIMNAAKSRREEAAATNDDDDDSQCHKSVNGIEKKKQNIANASASQAASSACFVMTAVGSLSNVTLRMANADRTASSTHIKKEEEPLLVYNDRVEIVSLVGTFGGCMGSAKHLHMVRVRYRYLLAQFDSDFPLSHTMFSAYRKQMDRALVVT
jgi:Plants and Prokaryotes Conserved (PCC) domain